MSVSRWRFVLTHSVSHIMLVLSLWMMTVMKALGPNLQERSVKKKSNGFKQAFNKQWLHHQNLNIHYCVCAKRKWNSELNPVVYLNREYLLTWGFMWFYAWWSYLYEETVLGNVHSPVRCCPRRLSRELCHLGKPWVCSHGSRGQTKQRLEFPWEHPTYW